MLLHVGRLGLFAFSMLVCGSAVSALAQDEAPATQTAEQAQETAHEDPDQDHQGPDHQGPDHQGPDHQDADHAANAAAPAAHGDAHGSNDPPGTPPLLSVDMGSAVCNILIFLGVFAVLAKFVWPVILNGLQAREDKIHGELEAAAKANSEAKSLLSDYQAKLDAAAAQVQTMLADARKDAESNGQRIVEEAKLEAERQRDRAVADIETAKKVALSELAGQTSDMAIVIAKQVVGRELKAADHADLIRQALDRLPSNN